MKPETPCSPSITKQYSGLKVKKAPTILKPKSQNKHHSISVEVLLEFTGDFFSWNTEFLVHVLEDDKCKKWKDIQHSTDYRISFKV